MNFILETLWIISCSLIETDQVVSEEMTDAKVYIALLVRLHQKDKIYQGNSKLTSHYKNNNVNEYK